MDDMITPEDEESLKRIRWTTIDVVVDYSASTESVSCGATTYPSHMSPIDNDHKIETRVIILKRLLKPMYVFKLRELSRLEPWGNDNLPFPTADRWIFVDLKDRTMWAAVDKPKLLDDFYKDLVNAELQRDKYIGYTIDSQPSTNLVPLLELKSSLVDWWCK